jgi:hypothetical protein
VASVASAGQTAGEPFEFVEPGNPLRPDFERFRQQATELPELSALLRGHGRGDIVRSVLRLYPDGPPRLKWLCVSIQRDAGSNFRSLTLLYRARKRRLFAFELPHDPVLESLPLLHHEVGEVLQYVPRHRFTYRVRRSDGGAAEIGKAVRRTDLDGAWRRLGAVWRAVQHSGTCFAVAEPRRLDRQRAIFYQGELPGADLAGRIDSGNALPLLRRAGRIQAEVHRLDVPGVPEWHSGELLSQLIEHARLVALFRPDQAILVESVLRSLFETVPRPLATGVFCHGDLRCGHLLSHDDRWSLIDLDGCRIGDPCQDVARFLAFLKRDVPYFREEFAAPGAGRASYEAGIAAYLEGYSDAAGASLDPSRLTWYLLAHELHFLARMFKRDLYEPVAFERSVDRVVRLREQLGEHLRGRRRP